MTQSLPEYRRHSRGLAFVQHRSIPTKDHRMYLGKYGTPESKKRYQEFLTRFVKSHPPVHVAREHMTIAHLGILYAAYAQTHYVRNGKATKDGVEMDLALKPLWEHFGNTLAEEFGPRSLTRLRKILIDSGALARGTINARVKRVRRFFRWAVSEEHVSPSLYHGLQSVRALAKGHPGTFETDPVAPVEDGVVAATIPWLSPQVAAMAQVQLLCGMRPAEVCKMRKQDIRFTDPTWLYLPESHKNSWRGATLVKAIPKVAQDILKPFLDRPDDKYLFSPAEAVEWQSSQRVAHYRATRKTPVYPSELKAREKAKQDRKRRPQKRPKGDRYTTDSYRRAISYAIAKAKKADVVIPGWFPLQLRHSIATRISQELGQQAAQRWLGHSDLETTGIYVEQTIKELLAIAREVDKMGDGSSPAT
jgi:integrase